METNDESEGTSIPPIECLIKSPNEPLRYAECKDEHKTHCYSIINIDNNNINNNNEIIIAGCWTGGQECYPPNEMPERLGKKYNEHFNNNNNNNNNNENEKQFNKEFENFKIPSSLLDPNIQDKCINYARAPDDVSALTRNNQSICCCSTSHCNSKIIITSESNPYEIYLQKISDHNKAYVRPPSTQQSLNILQQKSNSMNKSMSGQEIAVISLSVVIIFILVSLFLMFIFKKKIFFKSKHRFLPSIFYSNNQNSNNRNSQLETNNNNNNIILNNNPDYLENNQVMQPLLMHQTAAFASSIIAPNVQILPELLQQQQQQQKQVKLLPNNKLTTAFNINELDQLDENDFNENNIELSREDELIMSDPNYLNEPKPLKSSDLTLIEQIATGQFSSVWKACLTQQQNMKNNDDRVEYAIKIFASSQKTAWSNEKDIYNCLITLNENILNYFGSDQVCNNNNNKSQLPAFLLSNEYWLITEYHSFGSLHDFLKARLITWKQVVTLCYSFLEGLAYLHR
jgi:hypothetical protein